MDGSPSSCYHMEYSKDEIQQQPQCDPPDSQVDKQSTDRPVQNVCGSLQRGRRAYPISDRQSPHFIYAKRSPTASPQSYYEAEIVSNQINNSLTEEQAIQNAEELISNLFTDIIAKPVKQREFEIEENERKNELMFSRYRAMHSVKAGRLHDSLCKHQLPNDLEISKEDFIGKHENAEKPKAQSLIDSLHETSDYIYEYSKALCAVLGPDRCLNEEIPTSTAIERELAANNERESSKAEETKAV
ncbi:hypothetical protein Aperf_G00000108431 [Anoplocephala perfoliata]